MREDESDPSWRNWWSIGSWSGSGSGSGSRPCGTTVSAECWWTYEYDLNVKMREDESDPRWRNWRSIGSWSGPGSGSGSGSGPGRTTVSAECWWTYEDDLNVKMQQVTPAHIAGGWIRSQVEELKEYWLLVGVGFGVGFEAVRHHSICWVLMNIWVWSECKDAAGYSSSSEDESDPRWRNWWSIGSWSGSGPGSGSRPGGTTVSAECWWTYEYDLNVKMQQVTPAHRRMNQIPGGGTDGALAPGSGSGPCGTTVSAECWCQEANLWLKTKASSEIAQALSAQLKTCELG